MAARPETHMSSSSSSSSSSSESYDVFLSFRGEDTRGNFTDHLYRALNRAGIRTFRDNEELHKGKEIGQGLMNAIIESKISIPVFSENYASSKWCLKELAQIMKCMENDEQIVLPVFYKVNPSDIKHQTGSFAKAFREHEKTQPKEYVDSWRKALKQAGSLKGWHYEKPEHSEADMIDSIVEDVLNELKKTTALHVGDHLIGIDSRVDDVIRLLDLESQNAQYMGICGMGGVGKTTIARAVFNKICCHIRGDSNGLSFLEDVSSTSQQMGLVKLQEKLVSSILGNNLNFDNVAQGINIIKKRCLNKKVLIILDDVDRDEQLRALAGHPNWFGSGSRIIITTRDNHILKQVDETKIYMPKVLNDNQSLQLFCNHAFGKDQPPKDFMLLSRKVVKIVGGLPLAIEVLGSFLYGESYNEWESMVDSLEKIPHDDIQKTLQISYDKLNDSEKDTFLDIACFFIGMDKEIVIHILEDFTPKKNINILVRKSLVSIDDNNMLRMHDLLRDMGREIVRQKSPKKVGERTRLWSHGDALDVLKKGKDIYSTMPRGRDIAWEHMTSVDGSTSRVRCNYCHHEMSGGATRMKEHLLGKRGEVVPCTRIPRATQDHIRSEVDKSKVKASAKVRTSTQAHDDNRELEMVLELSRQEAELQKRQAALEEEEIELVIQRSLQDPERYGRGSSSRFSGGPIIRDPPSSSSRYQPYQTHSDSDSSI